MDELVAFQNLQIDSALETPAEEVKGSEDPYPGFLTADEPLAATEEVIENAYYREMNEKIAEAIANQTPLAFNRFQSTAEQIGTETQVEKLADNGPGVGEIAVVCFLIIFVICALKKLRDFFVDMRQNKDTHLEPML